ncbi:MAG: dTDP-4-amino-4,6-dideoxygalactose transaminase [Candidatus Omnitrophota bacterium]|jgi:dTDP-4-amino-4,6-dideoxygalactose transaminase
MKIPFNKPFIIGKELYYIKQAVENGHISGDGAFTKKCHAFLEKNLKAKKILLTTSCTAALEMASVLCEIDPGDEVILPSFTFPSTANAFYLRGAKLVFVDIRPDTLNIDEGKIENAITSRTKIIVPVHYAGVACEMDIIIKIAKQHKLYVVEDAAQGVNAAYKNKYLGTIGDFGAFSFHETKNYICGEGGAIVINNDKFIERAEIIRDKGTNRSKFFRGEIDKYTWIDVGSSYLPSDLLAAFLYAQFKNMKEITLRRKEIYHTYLNGLVALAKEGLLQLPIVPDCCKPNYHMFHIVVKNKTIRDDLLNYLSSKNIKAIFHYIPLHLSPVGGMLGYKVNQLPVTESISNRLLRLPFYYSLNKREQAEIIKEINRFFYKKHGK